MATDLDGLDELDAVDYTLDASSVETALHPSQPDIQPEPESQLQPSLPLVQKRPQRRPKRSKAESRKLLDSIWADLDLDGSGALEESELQKLLQQVSPEMSSLEVAELMTKLDKDQDGGVSKGEFLNWWMQQDDNTRDTIAGLEYVPVMTKQEKKLVKRTQAESEKLLKSIWNDLDLDGSGMLEESELQTVVQHLGIFGDMVGDETAIMMTQLDTDRNGGVSQKEFLMWWLEQDRDTKNRIAGAERVRAEGTVALSHTKASDRQLHVRNVVSLIHSTPYAARCSERLS